MHGGGWSGEFHSMRGWAGGLTLQPSVFRWTKKAMGHKAREWRNKRVLGLAWGMLTPRGGIVEGESRRKWEQPVRREQVQDGGSCRASDRIAQTGQIGTLGPMPSMCIVK